MPLQMELTLMTVMFVCSWGIYYRLFILYSRFSHCHVG